MNWGSVYTYADAQLRSDLATKLAESNGRIEVGLPFPTDNLWLEVEVKFQVTKAEAMALWENLNAAKERLAL